MIEFIVSHWWLWIIGMITGVILFSADELYESPGRFVGWLLTGISWICIIITIIIEIIKYAITLT